MNLTKEELLLKVYRSQKIKHLNLQLEKQLKKLLALLKKMVCYILIIYQ
ncbi:hypothetical protein HMPREF9945_03633 [Clostridioides difficile 70-100-2010]|nr:hypothetical protein HMPREF9945_03633 [Clostridioides difficile 70-100-2010]